MSLLRPLRLMVECQRTRASYYQTSNRKFPPAFVRRFFLRYPHAHLYIVFGLCSSAMVGPVLHSIYLYLTMSKEEFTDYKNERNALVTQRQKFGKNLWIPFFSSGEPDAAAVPTPSN